MLSTDSGGQGYSDIYNCEDGVGLTAPLPVDSYEVVLNLQDSRHHVLSAAMAPFSVDLTYAGQTVGLPNVNFTF